MRAQALPVCGLGERRCPNSGGVGVGRASSDYYRVRPINVRCSRDQSFHSVVTETKKCAAYPRDPPTTIDDRIPQPDEGESKIYDTIEYKELALYLVLDEATAA